MAKKFGGKSMRLGGGGRFAKAVAEGAPPGVMAHQGRAKYGTAQMAKWAAAGRKRAAKKRKKAG